MANFQVGQNFSSFLELKNYLSSFENEHFCKFYKRNSRKIDSAVRSGKTRLEINPDLIYYEITYCCVRGGALRVRGKGIRKTSSCKIECPAHISLRAAADGKTLKVKSFNNTHNHEISKACSDQKNYAQAKKTRIRNSLKITGNPPAIKEFLTNLEERILNLTGRAPSSGNDATDEVTELENAVSYIENDYDDDVINEIQVTSQPTVAPVSSKGASHQIDAVPGPSQQQGPSSQEGAVSLPIRPPKKPRITQKKLLERVVTQVTLQTEILRNISNSIQDLSKSIDENFKNLNENLLELLKKS